MRVSLLLATALAAVAAITPLAAAAGGAHTAIAPRARLGADHTTVVLAGTFVCVQNEHAYVKTYLFQASSGAVAEGRFPAHGAATSVGVCGGAPLAWTTTGTQNGKKPRAFQPGPAQACIVALTRARGAFT